MRRTFLLLLFGLLTTLTGFAQVTPSTEGEKHWYTIVASSRTTRQIADNNGVLQALDGSVQAIKLWQFVDRGDGSYNIINRATGKYISPDNVSNNTALRLTESAPTNGWRIGNAATSGRYILTAGSVQMNQTLSNLNYLVYNWGSGTNTTDAGCQLALTEFTGTLTEFATGTIKSGYNTTGLGSDLMLFSIPLTSDLENVDLSSVQLTLTNSDQLQDLRAYLGWGSEYYALPGPASLGTAQPAPTVNFTFTGADKRISYRTRYLYIAARVKSDATVGVSVGATLTGLKYTIGGTEKSATLTNVPAASAKIYTIHNHVWTSNMNNCLYYRIPAMVVAADGSLVSVIDMRYNSEADLGYHKIDLAVRRSTDNGRTWTVNQKIAEGDGRTAAAYGFGDAALVKAQSGKLVCLMAAGNTSFQSGMRHMFMISSNDNGVTWTTPEEVTTPARFTDNVTGQQGLGLPSIFTTSGRGICTADGRLMFLVVAKVAGAGSYRNFLLYSDDEGQTWTLGKPVVYAGADEAKLAQRPDGSILASIRQNGQRGFNVGSPDGLTWMGQTKNPSLVGNNCNADILTYDGELMIHSIIVNTSTRRDLRIFSSVDGGNTWRERTTISSADAAYSTLEKLNDGSLAVMFEDRSHDRNGYAITYLTIPADTIQSWKAIAYDNQKMTIVNSSSVEYEYRGTASANKLTWTSNELTGFPGLVLTAQQQSSRNRFFDQGKYFSQGLRSMVIWPSTARGTDQVNIQAPAGYVITGYKLNGACFNASETYTLTDCNGNTASVTSTGNPGTTPMLNVSGLNTASTFFRITTNNSTNNSYLIVPYFVVTLRALDREVKVSDNTGTGPDSYGDISSTLWTSNASSGLAGMTATPDNMTLDKASNDGVRTFVVRSAGAGAQGKVRFTAPFGYVITGYRYKASLWDSGRPFTITSDAPGAAAVSLTGTAKPTETTQEVSLLATKSVTLTFQDNSSAWNANQNMVKFYELVFTVVQREEQRSWDSYLASDVTPWFTQNVGAYYGLKQESYDEGRSTYEAARTGCTAAQYFALKNIVDAGTRWPETGYYLLQNKAYPERYLSLGSVLRAEPNVQQNPGSVLFLERQTDGSYTIQVQGKYVQQPAKSTDVSLGNTAVRFWPKRMAPGVVAYGLGGEYDYLHSGSYQSYNIVGWAAVADASQWLLSDARTVQLPATLIADKYYSTLCLPFAVDLPENAEAYTVEARTENQVYLSRLTGTLPAGTPVVIRYTPAETTAATATLTYTLADGTGLNAPSANILRGTLQPLTWDANAWLALGRSNNVPGFYTWSGSTLSANKAYIERSSLPSSSQAVAFSFDDVVTAIERMEQDTDSGTMYNLAGQRVQKDYKGIVIQQGSKQLRR